MEVKAIDEYHYHGKKHYKNRSGRYVFLLLSHKVREKEPQSGKLILFRRKYIKPYSSGVFRFTLMKFSFCTATYVDFSNYKYYRKPNFLSGYSRVIDINVAVDPTAETCSRKFQRNLTPKYSKTARVSKTKSGEEVERYKFTNPKGYYISLALGIP